MIKYLGSKRLLVDAIAAAARSLGASSALDLFSGTARVGKALKESGLYVLANDHLRFAATLARCYVQADARAWADEAGALLRELASTAPAEGYFTRTFCEEARYIQPHNGARIDAIRDRIAALRLAPELEAIALTALIEAADRVDSTTGVQMAFLKQWAKRSYNDLALRLPALTAGQGLALHLEAEDAADADVDVAYIDPPYNQHSYLGNYHMWETLARWDAPETYGIANKRSDCRAYKNPLNSKKRHADALRRVLARVRAKNLIASFSNEGFLEEAELREMLGQHGYVAVLSTDYKRYVGAQIGIHNPKGERVGRVSHLRNRELLFFVSLNRERAERARAAAQAAL